MEDVDVCRTMLQVTNDGDYKQYPTGRHLDFAYEMVVSSIEPPRSLRSPPTCKRQSMLRTKFCLCSTRMEISSTRSRSTKNYQTNSRALANAKSDLATAFALAQRDPAKLEVFPVTSQPLNLAVEQARDDLISEGGQKVEQALDVLGSIGEQMQAHMIKKAGDTFDDWNVGLSGSVPGNSLDSIIMPGNWCDGDDPQGFQKLIVDEAEVQHFAQTSTISTATSSFKQHAEAKSGGGAVMLGFCAFGGTAGAASMSSGFQNSDSVTYSNMFKNKINGLHIELEYGMCTIQRPWLVSDLFFLNDWTCVGVKKDGISDGTITDRSTSTDKIMPMIPQQFLVVRNVSITATNWGATANYCRKSTAAIKARRRATPAPREALRVSAWGS